MLKYRKIFFVLSSAAVGVSILAILIFGLNFGIDFTGGSLLEVLIQNPEQKPLPLASEIEKTLENNKAIALGDIKIQTTDQNTIIIKLRTLDEEEHQKVLQILESAYKTEPENGESISIIQKRFESIGPVISQELKKGALYQLALAILGIGLYIAYAFRKVAQLKEKSTISWKFSSVALITLFHDIMITIGLFAILGKFGNVEVDNAFIAAILMVFGYSINDTIVVFDRIRENLIKNKYTKDLGGIINKSVSETIVRSLNTSTTLLVLFAILLFGGSSIFAFVLTLIVGIITGTYSSIFLAAPLLYEWEKRNF